MDKDKKTPGRQTVRGLSWIIYDQTLVPGHIFYCNDIVTHVRAWVKGDTDIEQDNETASRPIDYRPFFACNGRSEKI